MQKLPIAEIIALGKLLDTQKIAAEISLPYNFQTEPLERGKISWEYGLKTFEKEDITICPKTFRPLSSSNGEQWEVRAEKIYKMNSGQLFKGRRYLQDFLVKYKKLPTHDELILFYYNRMVMSGKKPTLPFLTNSWTEQIISEYS